MNSSLEFGDAISVVTFRVGAAGIAKAPLAATLPLTSAARVRAD